MLTGRSTSGAGPDPGQEPLGRTLTAVAAAAQRGTSLLLYARTSDTSRSRSWARLSFGRALSSEADAALAFNPVLNAPADLHPTGLINGSRALAYRLSQRWRQVTPAGRD